MITRYNRSRMYASSVVVTGVRAEGRASPAGQGILNACRGVFRAIDFLRKAPFRLG